jgi:hypothetical protein
VSVHQNFRNQAVSIAVLTLAMVPVAEAPHIPLGNNERPWGHPGTRHKKTKNKRKGGKR